MDESSSKLRRRSLESSSTESTRHACKKPEETSGDRPVPLNQEYESPERLYGWLFTDFSSVLKPEEMKQLEAKEPTGKLDDTEDYVPNFLTRGKKYYESLPEKCIPSSVSQELAMPNSHNSKFFFDSRGLMTWDSQALRYQAGAAPAKHMIQNPGNGYNRYQSQWNGHQMVQSPANSYQMAQRPATTYPMVRNTGNNYPLVQRPGNPNQMIPNSKNIYAVVQNPENRYLMNRNLRNAHKVTQTSPNKSFVDPISRSSLYRSTSNGFWTPEGEWITAQDLLKGKRTTFPKHEEKQWKNPKKDIHRPF